MKPQVLVLNSGANYFPVNLEKELKDRPFTRFSELQGFIDSDRRSIPFLLIFELATNEDLEKALVAYNWAEVLDPRVPARFLFLAGKAVSFGERTAKLRGVEIAYLPINSRNLVFKLDLQLKLLEAAVNAQEQNRERSAAQALRQGFTAAMASLPGKPDRVMVLRGQERGRWDQAPAARGAKVRWRWVEDESAGGSAGPAAEEERIFWAAESEEAPAFEQALQGWVLAGPEPDVKAFRGEEELFSARKVIFAADGTELKKAEPKGETGSAIAKARAEKKEAPRTAPAPGSLAARMAAEGLVRTDQIELDLSEEKAAGAKREKPAVAADPSIPGVNTAEQKFAAEGAPAGAAARKVADAAPAESAEKEAKIAGENPAPAADKNKNSLATDGAEAAAGSVSASSRGSEATDTARKSVEGEGGSSAEPARKTLKADAASAAAPAKKGGPGISAEPLESAELRPEVASFAGEKTQSSRADDAGTNAPGAGKKKFRASAFEPTIAHSLKPEAYGRGKGEATNAGGPAGPGEETTREIEADGPAAAAKKKLAGDLTEEATRGVHSAKAGDPASEGTLGRIRADAEAGAEPQELGGRGNASDTPKVRIAADAPSAHADKRVAQAREEEPRTKIRGEDGGRGTDSVVSGRGPRANENEPSLTRVSFTMTLSELGDQNSSWQPSANYRIYLSARHRYYGFRHETELFPLWVYKGELAPEFLEPEKAWRFYDRRPEPFFARAELPPNLAEDLFSLLPKTPPLIDAGAGSGPALVAVPAGQNSAATGHGAGSAPAPAAKPGMLAAMMAFIRRLLE